MKRTTILLILILGIIASCVDPLDIEIEKEVNILIVEGSITTQPGPHYIRLTKSAKYGSIFDGFIRAVTGAEVIIRDSDGVNHVLLEDKENASIYYTDPTFLAQVGKSYTLLVTTAGGKEYTSLPEPIIAAPIIENLDVNFESTPLDDNVNKTGLAVLATYQDDPDAQNFYMWKSSGTYKIETSPENFLARDPNGGPAVIPAPKDCCSDCWVTEISDQTIRLIGDNNLNGNLITDKATFVEDDGIRFTDKYLVRIEQHTLTKEAFRFFKLLKQQSSISGDIFDPPPATLRGNMINLTNPNENVIGYFRASDVVIDSMYLTKDMLLEPKQLVQINDDCRTYKNANTIRPSYW